MNRFLESAHSSLSYAVESRVLEEAAEVISDASSESSVGDTDTSPVHNFDHIREFLCAGPAFSKLRSHFEKFLAPAPVHELPAVQEEKINYS